MYAKMMEILPKTYIRTFATDLLALHVMNNVYYLYTHGIFLLNEFIFVCFHQNAFFANNRTDWVCLFFSTDRKICTKSENVSFKLLRSKTHWMRVEPRVTAAITAEDGTKRKENRTLLRIINSNTDNFNTKSKSINIFFLLKLKLKTM